MSRRCSLLIVSALFAGALLTRMAVDAAADRWYEQGDAGREWTAAQPTIGIGALTEIKGALPIGTDVDLFCVRITNRGSFRATLPCIHAGAPDLYLFDLQGAPIVLNTDCHWGLDWRPEGKVLLNGALVPGNGSYLLAIAVNGSMAMSGTRFIWNPPAGTQRPPEYPFPLTSWSGGGAAPGSYTITLAGCEACTSPPVPARPGSWGRLKLLYR